MAKPVFVSIVPAMGARIPTNSTFEIKYSGVQLDTIEEHYITFEDSDGEPIDFSVSSVEYASSVSTFTVTPTETLSKNTFYDLTLLTTILDLNSEAIDEKSFTFMTKTIDETETIELTKVGQVNDVYFKKNLISDLLDNRDIILNGDKFNFSYIPDEYDPETYTYDSSGSEYLVHDLFTYIKERLKNQYFSGYETYFDNIKSFGILTTSQFLDIEKALYPRANDLAISSGLIRKIKFLIELYATASGKHFVLVDPDPHDPFKYYITTDVPNTAWSGTIKPIIHPIGWQEKYIELGSYNVEYDEWVASTAYVVGDRIQVEGDSNEFWTMEVSVAGTTGLFVPDWATKIVAAGSTVVDNSVTWTVVERLYQIHNFETDRYQWTETEIAEYRDLLYIKGEGRALTVNYITTTTNLELSDTNYLYLRAATSIIPARIVRASGSWSIDKVIENASIHFNGTSGGTNDGIYTVDGVVGQTVSASDACSSDETSDWTVESGLTVEFDKDHYEIATTAANKIMYLSDIEIVLGRTYKIDVQVKDGTAVGTQFQFYFNDGAVQLSATKTATSSWVTDLSDISTEFIGVSTTTVGTAGIKVITDQSGLNFEIKNFAITEMSQVELVTTQDLSNEVITITDSSGTGAYTGFDINERDVGLWVDGFIRPDPDTNEAINDRTSDLFDIDALSPDYRTVTVNNWAHSVYERYLDEPRWIGSTSYAVGDIIIANGYILRCTTTGTSGTTEPLWPFSFTLAETITDNTVVWTIDSLYNIDGWRANKQYYVGNNVIVQSYRIEVTVAGTSGIVEPTWPTSFTYEELVIDNTVTWKMLEVIETSRRDLLNVRNELKTFPKFPLNYLEALPIAGVTDTSAIIYDSFVRTDLGYKTLSAMTDQYDGDPYAVTGREELAHVTELKLVRGSSVKSFSNPGEDVTFLYTDEDEPIVWIQSSAFTTAAFSFGNTDLENDTNITPISVNTTDLLIDSISAPVAIGDGRYYQTITWNSAVTMFDIQDIVTGDLLDLQSAATTIDVQNSGEKMVWRHDHYNGTCQILNTSSGVSQVNIKSDKYSKYAQYNMESFLLPGTFSFDTALLAGFNNLVIRGQIDSIDWKATELFRYHYWVYDGGVDYSDDTVPGTPDEPFKTEMESEDNFTVVTTDVQHDLTDIVFESHRYNLSSIASDWTTEDLIYEYTDSGAGVPLSTSGTLFGRVEANIADTVYVYSDNTVNDDTGDWTDDGASVSMTFNISNFYEIYTSATDQHTYIDNVVLTQNQVYQVRATISKDTTLVSTVVIVNLCWYDGSSWQEGADITLDSALTEYSLTFTQSVVTTTIGRIGIRVRTDLSAVSVNDRVNFMLFDCYDTTNNLMVIGYMGGISPIIDTTKYYSNQATIPSSTILTTDTTYTIIGTTANLDPVTTYDRKLEVLYNIPDFHEYSWTATPLSGTALTCCADTNSLKVFVEQSATTCQVTLDVNAWLWRVDKVLTDTGMVTFNSEYNTISRDTGAWTGDDGVVVGDIIYIKGTINGGYHKIKSIDAGDFIVTIDKSSSIVDEIVADLPENTESLGKVIMAYTRIMYTIIPTKLMTL